MICFSGVDGNMPALVNRFGLLPYSRAQIAQEIRKWNTSFVEKFSSSISTSAEAREAYLEDAERMLLESGFVIPVYQGTTTWLLRDDLTKLYGDGMGHYYFFNVVEKAK